MYREETFRAIGIQSANDCPLRDPTNLTLSGKNDEDEWIVLMKVEGIHFNDRWEEKIFELPDKKAVKAKILKLDIESTPKVNEVQLGQFMLYE